MELGTSKVDDSVVYAPEIRNQQLGMPSFA